MLSVPKAKCSACINCMFSTQERGVDFQYNIDRKSRKKNIDNLFLREAVVRISYTNRFTHLNNMLFYVF